MFLNWFSLRNEESPRDGFAVSSSAGCPPSPAATARQPKDQL